MLHTDLKQLFTEDRGVSPVIGVILMVAVTVVLAALVGGFVFGLSNNLGESTPNAQIDFNYDSSAGDVGELTVRHAGGQSITGENTGALFTTGSITSGNVSDGNGDSVWNPDRLTPSSAPDRATVDSSISAGTIIIDGAPIASGETLQLQWESPNGDQTATLGTFAAP